MAWPNLLCQCRVFLCGMIIALLLSFSLEAQSQERRSYQLGTATTSDLPHAVGVTLAALIKLKLLPSTGIDISARNTSGSRDNVRGLQDNTLDFAILTSLDARDVAIASASLPADQADSGLRLVTNLWQETYHFVVRKDLVPGDAFSDFLKLRGIKVALGERGSNGFADSQTLLEAFGLNIDEAFEIKDFDRRDAAAAFLNGELDAFIFKTGSSDLDLLSFLEDAGASAVLLSISDDDIETANQDGFPAWSSVEISAYSDAGQDAAQRTFAMNYLLAAAASVDDQVVYQITKTIFDNLPVLQGMHSATDSISLQDALQQIFLPVHPGAERYYTEIGLELPAFEPVRVSNLTQTEFLTRFPTIEDARRRLRDDNVSILGGQDGETIGRFTSELAGDLNGGTLRVLGMTSPDPANNIAQVLYAKGVDSAFVPLDILNYAVENNIYPGMQDKLVYTTELFPQEFHLITTRDIDAIEDLAGQPVNLGTKNSGSEFTASFLFDQLKIPVEPTYFETRKALDLLKNGDLAAVVVIAGKPAPLLQQDGITDGLRLLEVPLLEGDAYRPASMIAIDYPGMLDVGETVDTFSVRTALITYNWRADNPRYATLSNFVSALFDRLASLKDDSSGLHPKWNDINPFAELEGWRRFSAAENWLNSDQALARPDVELAN